jgi:regulator of protease activity HflC (stomatin/prohibitin superfamily)
VTIPPIKRTSTGGKPNKALPFAFFLAALGVIALLGSFMFTLGEAGDPVVARTGTVFRTLDERLAATSGPKE